MPTTRSHGIATPRILALVAGLVIIPAAFGDDPAKPAKTPEVITESSSQHPFTRLAIDPDSAEGKAISKFNRERRDLEKKLLQIRYKYFRAQVAKVRREGIEKLSDFDNPEHYATLINVFEGQGEDVEDALLDMFAANGTDRGDAAITWVAVFGRRDGLREMATQKLLRRLQVNGQVRKIPARVLTVVIGGLRSSDDQEVINAALLAGALSMYDAIPFLIPAQVGQTGNAPDRQGDLAWIAIGKQVAYVADLNPVVSDSSVAFDPIPGVVTEGSLLRIQDAVVKVYRGDVQVVLKRLGGDYTGRPVPELGFNMNKWWEWYREEVVPQRIAREQAEKAAAQSNNKTPSEQTAGR